jgi:hypothetical protein
LPILFLNPLNSHTTLPTFFCSSTSFCIRSFSVNTIHNSIQRHFFYHVLSFHIVASFFYQFISLLTLHSFWFPHTNVRPVLRKFLSTPWPKVSLSHCSSAIHNAAATQPILYSHRHNPIPEFCYLCSE